jgi:hypothetical protein
MYAPQNLDPPLSVVSNFFCFVFPGRFVMAELNQTILYVRKVVEMIANFCKIVS